MTVIDKVISIELTLAIHCNVYLSNAPSILISFFTLKGKGKGHRCTGTEALYRPYGS
jgi:hypothetical protein